jgi:AraC-like DNA-binding protein
LADSADARERVIEKHLVSAAVHLPAWEWARREGIDVTRLLEGTGVEEREVRDPGCVLTTAQHFRFLHNLIAVAPDPAVGLIIGHEARLQELGMLGLLMLCAPSIRDALEVGAEFSPLGGSLGDVRVREEDRGVVVRLRLPPLSLVLSRHLTEAFFASLGGFLRMLSSEPSLLAVAPAAEPVGIAKLLLAYPPPPHADRYGDFFDCRVSFGAEESGAWFDAESLNRPPMLSNPLAFDQCRRVCVALASERREDSPLIREARHHIARDPAGCSSIAELADAMDTPPRTLQRRFSRLGTTFSQLQADVRHALAQDLLSNPELTNEEIATVLGYSDATSFRRAFRQWAGEAPSSFRRRL